MTAMPRQRPTAFDDVPRTAAGHFRLNFSAAIYGLMHMLHGLDGQGSSALEDILKSHRFLRGYLEQIVPRVPAELGWSEVLAWWQCEITAWEDACTPLPPLARLARASVLSFAGRMALMTVALADEDARFGPLFAALQAPLASRRASMTLVGEVLRARGAPGQVDPWLECQALLASGLLQVENPAAARPDWTFAIPQPVWGALRGQRLELPGCTFHAADGFPALGELLFDAATAARIAQVPALLESGQVQVLAVRGMPGSDQLQIAGAIARALGRTLAVLPAAAPGGGAADSSRLLGPLCVMGPCIPVHMLDLAPGATAELPTLPAYDGPVLVVLGMEGGIASQAARPTLTIDLALPTPELRRLHWQRALGPRTGADLERLSARFALPAGHLRELAATAIGHAGLERRETIEVADVRLACRELNRHQLDAHATRLDGAGSWSDLVVSEATTLRLRDLETRCRQRERLPARLSAAYGTSALRGVRGLFTGGSGTGKTLAARVLAAELDMDLYRVDLAAVVDKYIGQTEKNLHQVLSRAEALDVILLLDEGDSLLASRTEVKSANDRYANLETNYLLQRLESYQGIVLVTTNAAQNIDRAFQRRMDVVVPFVHPQADERRAIWSLHLPADHAVAPAFIAQVAQRCALSGAQIRNAALQATLLAVDDGSATVGNLHVEAAIHNEYRKAGAASSLGIDLAPAPPVRGMTAFLEAIRS